MFTIQWVMANVLPTLTATVSDTASLAPALVRRREEAAAAAI